MPVAIAAAISLAECPASAPNVVFEGLVAPGPWSFACPVCSCDPPAGSCELPTTWTVSSASCAEPASGVKTTFDPPQGWDGACSKESAIIGGKLCGGVPCVESITVSEPLIHESPCTPHGDEPIPEPAKVQPDSPFILSARACSSAIPPGSCSNEGQVCVPKQEGFRTCIRREGEQPCPDGWGERHVFHADVDDQRFCEPCSCSAPAGGSCEVRFRLFSDDACAGQILAVNLYSDMGEKCHDLAPGIALGSKSAELIAYEPGSCMPSGGGPVGEVVLSEPVTFCCREAST